MIRSSIMSTQSALIVSEVGKPLTKTTRLIPAPKENEILVKVMSAGRKFCHRFVSSSPLLSLPFSESANTPSKPA
jgi:hypothetical protein